jgi:hypothetical protein
MTQPITAGLPIRCAWATLEPRLVVSAAPERATAGMTATLPAELKPSTADGIVVAYRLTP